MGNEQMALSICMKCGKTECLKKMPAQSLLNTGMSADQNAMEQDTKNRMLITICKLLSAQGQWSGNKCQMLNAQIECILKQNVKV